MKSFRSILFLMVVLGLGFAGPFKVSADSPSVHEWKQISDDDGIRVFTKEIPESPIVGLRGEGMIEASVEKIAMVLRDSEHAAEWMDSLVEMKDLKPPTKTEYLRYTHFRTPIVMKDRDFVTLGRSEVDPKTGTFFVNIKSVESPLAPKTDYVRGEILQSSFTVKPVGQNQSFVVVEFNCDPKGSVAKWIVNMFQKNWPRNTLKSLRKQATKPS